MMPWISESMTYEYLVNIKAIENIFLPEIKLIKKIRHIDEDDLIPDSDKDYLSCMYTYIF